MSEDKPTSTTPHDALFKHAFSEVGAAAALLRCVVPTALADAIDWDTLRRRSGDAIDEWLQERRTDLLYSARVGDQEVFVYLLLEHQSSPDPMMAWRMWRYALGICEFYRDRKTTRLPLVVPIVVYHGARPWSASRDVETLFDVPDVLRDSALPVPRCEYLLDDLRLQSAEELRARGLPAFAAVALWALRVAHDRSFVDSITIFADLFNEIARAPDGPRALTVLLRYLSRALDDDAVIHTIVEGLPPIAHEVAVSYYDRLFEKGREQGIEQGIERGLRTGLARSVLMQARLKFVDVPEAAVASIDAASEPELERLLERMLTARSLDELLADD